MVWVWLRWIIDEHHNNRVHSHSRMRQWCTQSVCSRLISKWLSMKVLYSLISAPVRLYDSVSPVSVEQFPLNRALPLRLKEDKFLVSSAPPLPLTADLFWNTVVVTEIWGFPPWRNFWLPTIASYNVKHPPHPPLPSSLALLCSSTDSMVINETSVAVTSSAISITHPEPSTAQLFWNVWVPMNSTWELWP